jgi:hypothetical protein
MHNGEQSENGAREPEVEAHRLDAIEVRDEDDDERAERLRRQQGFQVREET